MMAPLYRVKVGASFEASHRLRSYRGKPEAAHSHEWKVEVEVETARLDSEGMVLDFHELDSRIKALVGRFEGKQIHEIPPFTDLPPTAENLARWFHDELKPRISKNGVRIVEVRVFEEPDFSAAFRDD